MWLTGKILTPINVLFASEILTACNLPSKVLFFNVRKIPGMFIPPVLSNPSLICSLSSAFQVRSNNSVRSMPTSCSIPSASNKRTDASLQSIVKPVNELILKIASPKTDSSILPVSEILFSSFSSTSVTFSTIFPSRFLTRNIM